MPLPSDAFKEQQDNLKGLRVQTFDASNPQLSANDSVISIKKKNKGDSKEIKAKPVWPHHPSSTDDLLHPIQVSFFYLSFHLLVAN